MHFTHVQCQVWSKRQFSINCKLINMLIQINFGTPLRRTNMELNLVRCELLLVRWCTSLPQISNPETTYISKTHIVK